MPSRATTRGMFSCVHCGQPIEWTWLELGRYGSLMVWRSADAAHSAAVCDAAPMPDVEQLAALAESGDSGSVPRHEPSGDLQRVRRRLARELRSTHATVRRDAAALIRQARSLEQHGTQAVDHALTVASDATGQAFASLAEGDTRTQLWYQHMCAVSCALLSVRLRLPA